jgi:serine/threonine protein kinase
MEYLEGLTLDGLLAVGGPLDPGRVVYLLRQACDALAEAHAAGLIHRDLKPANLFVTRRGGRCDFIKVLDFGLVQEVNVRPPAGRGGDAPTVCGTPAYMAPEQVLNDRPLDPRCDLYAIGSIAHELLTGRPPFDGASPSEIMDAQIRSPVVPPSQLRPEVEADLERVVLRCLAKAPEDRFPSAEELGQALAACESSSRWDDRKAASWWEEYSRRAMVVAVK